MKTINRYLIMCMPISIMPIPPADQSECIQENCEECSALMWVSKKKREMRTQCKRGTVQTICMFCAAKEAVRCNLPDENIIDLAETKH